MYFDGQWILTNTQTHESYSLDKETFCKLADENADSYPPFLEAKIVDDGEVFDWPFRPLSRFFMESARLKEDELDSKDVFEFWENYLNTSESLLRQTKARDVVNSDSVLDLPKAREIPGTLFEALKNRRTIREFFDKPVSLQEFSDILFTTFGRFHEGFGEESMDVAESASWRRSSPSAGGLHSIDAYVFVRKVENLPIGIYFYDSKNHQLRFLKEGDFEVDLVRNFMGQYFCMGAAFHVATVANLRVVEVKYKHSSGVLLPFLDNGHLVQTAILTATNLGLQNWMTAATCVEFLSRALNLRPFQLPLSVFSIGHGSKSSLGPRIRSIIRKIREKRLLHGAMAVKAAIREKVLANKIDENLEK